MKTFAVCRGGGFVAKKTKSAAPEKLHFINYRI